MMKRILLIIFALIGLSANAQLDPVYRSVLLDSLKERTTGLGMWFRGNFRPTNDLQFDIGSSARRYDSVFLKTVVFADGSSQSSGSGYFVTPQQFGAVGTGLANDSRAWQNMINSFTDSIVLVYVPYGIYRIDTSIIISNKKQIKIWGQGTIVCNQDTGAAILVNGGPQGAVSIEGIAFNFNSKNVNNSGIKIYNRAADKLEINNCQFLNFADTAQIGIYLVNAGGSAQDPPYISIFNCHFYDFMGPTYSYNFNNKKPGRGIVIDGETQYGTIQQCSFGNIGTAVWFKEAANWMFNDNVIEFCRGNIGTDVYAQGVLHMSATSVNNGKLTIANNKLNHLYGIAIYSDYSPASVRPMTIDGNHLIGNCARDIVLTSGGHTIYGNFFDRINEIPSNTTNSPFDSDTAKSYIVLTSSTGTQVSLNNFTYFANDAKYAVKTISSTETYFTNNHYQTIGLSLNIPDAISYVDTVNAGTRYINNSVFMTGTTLSFQRLSANGIMTYQGSTFDVSRYGAAPAIRSYSIGGTLAVPAATVASADLPEFSIGGYTGSGKIAVSTFGGLVNRTFTTTSFPHALYIKKIPSNSTNFNYLMYSDSNNKVFWGNITAIPVIASATDVEVRGTGNTNILNVRKADTTSVLAVLATGNVVVNSTLIATNLQAASAGNISWNNNSQMTSTVNGIITLLNAGASSFTRLNFGGTTSTFPALSRSSTGIDVKLADNSAFATIRASNIIDVNGDTGAIGEVLTKASMGYDWNNILTNGTYTPTLTNGTNISASTPHIFTYTRNGNVVTYAGTVDITTTIAVASELGISLPIASAFTITADANGVGNAETAIATNGVIKSDAANDRLSLNFIGLSVSGSGTIYVSGQYLIK